MAGTGVRGHAPQGQPVRCVLTALMAATVVGHASSMRAFLVHAFLLAYIYKWHGGMVVHGGIHLQVWGFWRDEMHVVLLVVVH